jgi:hypothetical protein
VIALVSTALAADGPPVRQASGPAAALVWARPFALDLPEADPNDRGATVSEGWLVEVRAAPALLVPSDGPEAWLYAGEARTMKLNWDWAADPAVGGCLVAIVSGPVDLAATPLFFGVPPSSSSSDAERAALARSEAARLGIRPFSADQVAKAVAAGGPELVAHDLRDVRAAGMARVGACTSTAADRARAGVR